MKLNTPHFFTAAVNCGIHKRHRRDLKSKDMTLLKSKCITLPSKVLTVKGMVFPVVMYGCESWAIKKTEH